MTVTETTQLCTFYLDDLYLGVDVMKVQEVIRYQEMTRVPLAPPAVRGLINLRGQIVMAIDLRQRLGLQPASGDGPPMNVVVREGDGAVSLLVDEIGDVLEPSEDAFEEPPENLRASADGLIRGVYKLEDRLLLVLDAGRATRFDP